MEITTLIHVGTSCRFVMDLSRFILVGGGATITISPHENSQLFGQSTFLSLPTSRIPLVLIVHLSKALAREVRDATNCWYAGELKLAKRPKSSELASL